MDKPPCEGSSSFESGIIGKIVTWVTTGISIASGVDTVTTLAAGAKGIIAAAGGGALIGISIVFVSAIDRLSSKPGSKLCYAGVVTAIEESFNDAWDVIAPYTAQHDRADIVIKPTYWPIVLRGPYVWCNIDTMRSPLIRSYYKSSDIIGAAIGSIIGAVIGAAAGFFAGLFAGAAIGCAFVLLCLLAMLLALLVALITTLVGAFIGGNIGRVVGGVANPTGITTQGLPSIENVVVGDYVTIKANVALYGEDNNAVVAWWVESTCLHGRSTSGEGPGHGHPFNFVDPRDKLTPDACEQLPSHGIVD